MEKGRFTAPSEAVFVMMQNQKELEAHSDLKREVLRRSIEAAIQDPRPGISDEELEKELDKLKYEDRAEPAVWPKRTPIAGR